MKNILVPCDFSKPAVNAFRFALDIAGRSKGIVYLLNVIELPAIHNPIIMPVISFEKEFLNELKEKTSKEFDKIITKYKPDAVEVRTEVSFGAAFRMIQDFIKKKKIDIVIMGSHGATGIREYFIGSNAVKFVGVLTYRIWTVALKKACSSFTFVISLSCFSVSSVLGKTIFSTGPL